MNRTRFASTWMPIATFVAALFPAYAQIIGHPVMNRTMLISVQPDFYQLVVSGKLTKERVNDANRILNSEVLVQERLAACQRLLADPQIDFPTRRWTAMQLILVYSEMNDAKNLEAIANKWLATYPNERQFLPEEWRIDHPVEPRINIYLRGFLAHCYLHVVNDQFNWSAEERKRKFEEVLEGASAESSEPSIDVVHARLYLVKGLPQAIIRTHTNDNPQTTQVDEATVSTQQVRRYSLEQEAYEKCVQQCGQALTDLESLAQDELIMLENGMDPEHIDALAAEIGRWQTAEEDRLRRASSLLQETNPNTNENVESTVDKVFSELRSDWAD